MPSSTALPSWNAMTLVATRICGLLFVGMGPIPCAANEPSDESTLSQMGRLPYLRGILVISNVPGIVKRFE